MSNQDVETAWTYHELTKHSYWSIRTSAHYLDWANMPSPFKVYPEIEPIPLPRELVQTGVPALAAVASTGVEPASEIRPALEQLASLLYYTAGVTRTKSYPQHSIYFRAAACAGALYPVETYVVSGDIKGLAAGVYHFNPGDFSLRCLRRGDHRGVLVNATAAEARVAAAPVTLVFSAITWRSSWKYRDRSYRYHFWDNGMIAANALALAASYGWPARLVMGFVEADINRLIAIDGERELALCVLPLGYGATEATAIQSFQELEELRPEVLPLSQSQVDYASIIEMHRSSSLSNPDEASEWRQAAIEQSVQDATGSVIPMLLVGSDQLPGVSIEEVIQRRASTRRFALKPILLTDLSVIVDRATRGVPADFLKADSQLNDIYLIANRVDGLEAGAYYYRRTERAFELLKRGDFSTEARYLSLEQELAGDASAALFFMVNLRKVLKLLGNRGYRAAQMEAGIIGGKLYLGAYSLNRGATGLTFYDDDVTSFFSPHAAGKSCIFEMAIGVPGKRPLL